MYESIEYLIEDEQYHNLVETSPVLPMLMLRLHELAICVASKGSHIPLCSTPDDDLSLLRSPF